MLDVLARRRGSIARGATNVTLSKFRGDVHRGWAKSGRFSGPRPRLERLCTETGQLRVDIELTASDRLLVCGANFGYVSSIYSMPVRMHQEPQLTNRLDTVSDALSWSCTPSLHRFHNPLSAGCQLPFSCSTKDFELRQASSGCKPRAFLENSSADHSRTFHVIEPLQCHGYCDPPLSHGSKRSIPHQPRLSPCHLPKGGWRSSSILTLLRNIRTTSSMRC